MGRRGLRSRAYINGGKEPRAFPEHRSGARVPVSGERRNGSDAVRAESAQVREVGMPIVRTTIRQECGVRLIRVDTVRADKIVTASHLRLTTLRPDQPRIFADLGRANAAYAAEVKASKADPTAVRLAATGH